MRRYAQGQLEKGRNGVDKVVALPITIWTTSSFLMSTRLKFRSHSKLQDIELRMTLAVMLTQER